MGLTIPPLLTPAIPSAYSRHPLCLLPSSPRRRGSRGRWPCPTDVIPAKAGIHYVIPNNGGKNRQPQVDLPDLRKSSTRRRGPIKLYRTTEERNGKHPHFPYTERQTTRTAITC